MCIKTIVCWICGVLDELYFLKQGELTENQKRFDYVNYFYMYLKVLMNHYSCNGSFQACVVKYCHNIL